MSILTQCVIATHGFFGVFGGSFGAPFTAHLNFALFSEIFEPIFQHSHRIIHLLKCTDLRKGPKVPFWPFSWKHSPLPKYTLSAQSRKIQTTIWIISGSRPSENTRIIISGSSYLTGIRRAAKNGPKLSTFRRYVATTALSPFVLPLSPALSVSD